jgi:LysM repeat protein
MTRKQAAFIIVVNAMISTVISLCVAFLVLLPRERAQEDPQQPVATPIQTANNAAQGAGATEAIDPAPPTATPIVYIVQPGDTISSLALKFDVPGADIIAANQIQNPDFLVAGVELSIPVGGLPPVTTTWTPIPAASETPLPFEPPSVNLTATALSSDGGTSGVSPGTTPIASGLRMEISEIRGVGDAEQELVTITNAGDQLADLEGWTLSDAEGNTYVFPNYRLWPAGSVTVHTGIGLDGDPMSSLFWGRLEPVWAPGEVATLRTNEGITIVTYVMSP